MTSRLAYALAHPLNRATNQDMSPYQRVEQQRDGNLLLSTLAVDR